MIGFLIGFVLGAAVTVSAIGIVSMAVNAAYRSQDFDQ